MTTLPSLLEAKASETSFGPDSRLHFYAIIPLYVNSNYLIPGFPTIIGPKNRITAQYMLGNPFYKEVFLGVFSSLREVDSFNHCSVSVEQKL